MYDFILFEHSGLKNHCVDLSSIGRMLCDSGYTVAIADVTIEGKECRSSGLPILEVKASRGAYKSHNAYMKAVFDELSQLTQSFYAGSILSDTRLSWLKNVPSDKKVFLWALRSFFFTEYKRPRLSRNWPSKLYNSIYNLRITKRLKNVRFCVSNPIIRDEFESLGYESWRLVIRQERTCSKLIPTIGKKNSSTNFLIIGALRPEKRIDLCIKALDEIKSNNLRLTIAGKAYTVHGYDKMIETLSSSRSYIKRISKRLDEDEYNALITNCDYMVLSDEKQASCVTNGTMSEALLAGRPIIAPNYNPYKFIIDNYKVGFLYEMHNHQSLLDAFYKAISTNPVYFAEGIEKFQKDLLYDKVISAFSTEVRKSLNC